MTVHLLATKISVPLMRSRLEQRKRLFDILDQSEHPRLILVTALAGYGKTTLLSGWVRQTHR